MTTSSSDTSATRLPPPSDANMEATYNGLAQRAIDLYRSKKGSGAGGRCWIGIAGGPGAGKSTLAAAVADKICKQAASVESSTNENTSLIRAVAIPMDGYHYTRKELAQVSKNLGFDGDGTKGMSRRGAPWTFDALGLARDLKRAKELGKASLPEYDRKLSDPVDNAVVIEKSHQIVLVEGNYLILGRLIAQVDDSNLGTPGSPLETASFDLECPVAIGEEIERWRDVDTLWDETWFVAPPKNAVKVQRDRIVERSLETWNPSKTAAWGGDTDRKAAENRADFNDVRNAKLVECCRSYADAIIDSI